MRNFWEDYSQWAIGNRIIRAKDVSLYVGKLTYIKRSMSMAVKLIYNSLYIINLNLMRII